MSWRAFSWLLHGRAMVSAHVFRTTHGFVALAWRGEAVVGLRLPDGDAGASERALRRRWPDAMLMKPTGAMANTVKAISRYFAGAHEDFRDVPVELGRQEPFFTRVDDHVRTLGWGETTSYGEVARALHATPEAARSVGQAMARNPVPLIIPCHRVLAAGGRIGGFSAPGGSDAKLRMLELEGAVQAERQASFAF